MGMKAAPPRAPVTAAALRRGRCAVVQVVRTVYLTIVIRFAAGGAIGLLADELAVR